MYKHFKLIALGECVIILVATTINDIIMGYGSLRFFFAVILLKYLRKDVKNSVNIYKNFKASIFIKVYMYMYIYNQNKFKYINILSTSIQDMKMSLVPSKLRQIGIFKNRENPGSNRPSVPSACRKRHLSDESVITEALV